MPKKLTVAEQAIVAKASQDLYRYERICEEHSAVLRRDPDGLIRAHQEYTANLPPMGFMPTREEFDRYIEESEKVLKNECKTALDHIHVVHAAFFLCRLLMRSTSEHGERVSLAVISQKAELTKQHPYIFPESPAVAIHASSAAPSDYPITLPARGFKSKQVITLPRVPLQETELIQYQRCPELLQTETFLSFNEDDEEYQAFRIPAFLTADGGERTFYVVHADQGPEAVAWSSVHLFDLRASERVLN